MVRRFLCCCGRILLSSNKKIISDEVPIKEDCLPLHPKQLPPWGSGSGVPLGSCSALGHSSVILHNPASRWRICPRSFLLTVFPQLPAGFSCLADMAPGRCPLRTTGILSAIGSSSCLQDIVAPGGHPHPLCCSTGKKISAGAGVLLPPTPLRSGGGQEGA